MDEVQKHNSFNDFNSKYTMQDGKLPLQGMFSTTTPPQGITSTQHTTAYISVAFISH
jgi:hypothetical protein